MVDHDKRAQELLERCSAKKIDGPHSPQKKWVYSGVAPVAVLPSRRNQSAIVRYAHHIEASQLQLTRQKPNGKYAQWLFRFTAFDEEGEIEDASPC